MAAAGQSGDEEEPPERNKGGGGEDVAQTQSRERRKMRIEASTITPHASKNVMQAGKGCTRPDHEESWAPWINDTAFYLGSPHLLKSG